MPIVSASFPLYQHANLQVGIDAYLAGAGRTADLIGVAGPGRSHQSFAEILAMAGVRGLVSLGAPDYASVPVGVDAERACVSFGIYLVADGGARPARRRHAAQHRPRPAAGLRAGGASPPSTEIANAALAEIRDLMARHNIFRGQVISFEPHDFGRGVGPLSFHRRPDVAAADVILPPGVLDDAAPAGDGRRRAPRPAARRRSPPQARHPAVRPARHRQDAHHPPPDGPSCRGATVIVLTGLGLGMVREACALARLVAPALIVLEDVDLVAEERTMHPGGSRTRCSTRCSTRWTGSPATPTSRSCSPPTGST